MLLPGELDDALVAAAQEEEDKQYQAQRKLEREALKKDKIKKGSVRYTDLRGKTVFIEDAVKNAGLYAWLSIQGMEVRERRCESNVFIVHKVVEGDSRTDRSSNYLLGTYYLLRTTNLRLLLVVVTGSRCAPRSMVASSQRCVVCWSTKDRP